MATSNSLEAAGWVGLGLAALYEYEYSALVTKESPVEMTADLDVGFTLTALSFLYFFIGLGLRRTR